MPCATPCFSGYSKLKADGFKAEGSSGSPEAVTSEYIRRLATTSGEGNTSTLLALLQACGIKNSFKAGDGKTVNMNKPLAAGILSELEADFVAK